MLSTIFAAQLSRKDGGNWSCDVLATQLSAARGGLKVLLPTPGDISGRKIMARFE